MKEGEPIFRPYLVCYNENRYISNCTKGELEEIIKKEKVDWINHRGQRLDEFELLVYGTKLALEEKRDGIASNREIADTLSTFSEEPISRIAVARARNNLARKMDFQKGW